MNTRLQDLDSHSSADLNVIALVKKDERYMFFYDEGSADTLLQTLGQFAVDKDLSFTWYDAAVISQKVRRILEEAEKERVEQWRAEDNG